MQTWWFVDNEGFRALQIYLAPRDYQTTNNITNLLKLNWGTVSVNKQTNKQTNERKKGEKRLVLAQYH